MSGLTGKRVVFLDRDGVINRFPGKGVYVTKKKQFEFLPKSLEAIRVLSEAGFQIYVVSNQGCVSRKMITEKKLMSITESMLKAVEKAGGKINEVFYCVHQTSDACDCKKPKTTLFEKALAGKKINRSFVYLVGDSEEDMRAGKNLGCRTVLVLSGRLTEGEALGLSAKPDVVKRDLWEAAHWIIQK